MKAASRMLLPLCSRSLWRHPQMSLNSSALDPILFIACNSPLRRFNIYILFTRSQLEFSTQFQRCWIRSFCSTILEPRRMLGELDCALWWPEWWGAFVVASSSTRRIDSSEYLDLFRVELFRCIRNFSKEQILIFYNKFRHRITISTLPSNKQRSFCRFMITTFHSAEKRHLACMSSPWSACSSTHSRWTTATYLSSTWRRRCWASSWRATCQWDSRWQPSWPIRSLRERLPVYWMLARRSSESSSRWSTRRF